MRDVNNGWLIRIIHANGASMFFICLYAHIARGLFYNSFVLKHTWIVGVTIFILTIGTAFLGYVLPWGNMSYWAATVITELATAIPYFGHDIVTWLWGGFSVSNATLIRFYALHFILPIVIAALRIVHMLLLHDTGSRNPLGLDRRKDLVKFHPYYTVKDLVGFMVYWLVLGATVLYFPNLLIDPQNFIPANPLVTPLHIQPEWYFLPMYAILRSVPNKLGGVTALAASLLILYFIPLYYKPGVKSSSFNVFAQYLLITLGLSFFILMWIGRKPVEVPFEGIGQFFTVLYFACFMRMPLINK